MDERFCDHHRDCGAAQLAALMGTTPHDVISHMGALGVDISPIPLIGEVCPSCGRRMPVRGRAAENGVCDACNTRMMMELRAVREAERRAWTDSSSEAGKRSREGGGS